MASCTVFGILWPYLWFFWQYFLAVLDMIRSHLFRVYLVHHAKTGSSTNSFSDSWYAIWMVYKSLTSFSWFQVDLSSLHWMQTSQTLVVSHLFLFPFFMWMNSSGILIWDQESRQTVQNVARIDRIVKKVCLLSCCPSWLIYTCRHIPPCIYRCPRWDCQTQFQSVCRPCPSVILWLS